MEPRRHGLSSQYMHDQDGMRAIGAAIAALADDPYPPEAFHRGRYHPLRVGRYRVVYTVEDELITIDRVDRVATD
jgi:mRNA-degrading endonuclease RelE of RelBE toxin-antitoxin system